MIGVEYRWVSYEQARPALACSQYLCLSESPAQNGSATESVEKRQETENMEESSEIEDNNEEMNSDALIVDAGCLALNGEAPSPNNENGLASSHSAEKDETTEENEDHSESLGKIILLLNNKCLTFKVHYCSRSADAHLFSPFLSLVSCSCMKQSS